MAGLGSSKASELLSNQNTNMEGFAKICSYMQCDISSIDQIVMTENNL